MQLIFFLVFLVISAQLATASPPRLIPYSPEVTFPATSTFNLTCDGDDEVLWDHSERVVDKKKLRMESRSRFSSILFIENASYEDVGYYYCLLKGAKKNDKKRASKIYVYVKDTTHLVAAQHYELYSPNHGHSHSLPCKPAFPEVQVKLYKDDELIEIDQKEVKYDDKIGFTFRSIVFKMHQGIYTCSGEWQSQEPTEVTFEISVQSVPSFTPKPEIHDIIEKRYVTGDNFNLSCSVQVEQSTKFEIDWFGPLYKNLSENKRATIKKTSASRNGATIVTLTVEMTNVTMADKGNYTCTITTTTGNKESTSKVIDVTNAGDSFLYLSVNGQETIYTKLDEPEVQWVVTIDAHPEPSLKYKAPNGKEIDTGIKYNMTKKDNMIVFKIKNIMIQDVGTYQIIASTSKERNTLSLTLKIGAPAIILKGEQTVFRNGSTYYINCTVYAHPEPEIKWFFKKCSTPLQCLEYREVTSKNKQSNDYRNGQYLRQAYRLEAEESGIIKCYAKNSRGVDEKNITVIVSDIPGGFYVDKFTIPANESDNTKHKKLTYVEGDNVNIVCAANTFNYTKNIVWYRETLQKKQIQERTDALGAVYIKDETGTSKLSYKKVLVLQNASRNASGRYMCEASHSIQGKPKTIGRVELIVKAIKMPAFRSDTNLKNETTKRPEGQMLQLSCFANGEPKPTIKWMKNGKVLDVKKNGTKYTFHREGHTVSFHLKKGDEGRYECIAENRGGKAVQFTEVVIIVENGSLTALVIAIIVVIIAIIGLIAAIIILGKKMRQKRKLMSEFYLLLSAFENGALERYDPEIPLGEQADFLPYDKRWEFSIEKLTLGKQLGSGAFGRVVQGEADGILTEGEVTTVAVKMVNSRVDLTHLKSLVSELKIMSHLGNHLNIVNLLGACTSNLRNRELFMIVEYCPKGNIQKYLQRHRNHFLDQINPSTGYIDVVFGELMRKQDENEVDGVVFWEEDTCTPASQRRSRYKLVDYRTESASVPLSPTSKRGTSLYNDKNYVVKPLCTSDLVCWSFQIAKGMEYLASKQVLHRDLAARNVLLCYDNIVKICDFGLAKEVYNAEYKKKTDGALPVKWMALESIQDRVFSTQSDIWAFGILLWELFSLGQMPYPGLDAGQELYHKLFDGYRMEKPKYATADIYKIMMDCWKAKPNQRPNFTTLANELGNMLEQDVRENLITSNEPYEKMNERNEEYINPACLKATYVNSNVSPTSHYQNLPTSATNSEYIVMKSPTSANPPSLGRNSGYFWMKGTGEDQEAPG